MVHERTTSGAGLRPATQARATPPAPEPHLPPTTDPSAPTLEPPSPAALPTEPPATSGPVPVEEAPLDPRAIARASLAAGRNASLWWVSAGIVVALVVAVTVGSRAGSVVLAAVVAACGIARWATPTPGPVALSVRARWIDVGVLFTLAVGLGVLAASLPDGWF